MTCFFTACNVVKRVGATDYLLTENSYFHQRSEEKIRGTHQFILSEKECCTAWNSLAAAYL